jgi:hypothetical protein
LFQNSLPPVLRRHRQWFSGAEGRGFGEDAFHVMWWLLFHHYRPQSFLEIGVYRGQVVSLAALLHRELGIRGEVVGITPLSPLGDSVSRYRNDVDYGSDIRHSFERFGLPHPTLVATRSCDASAVECIRSREWDCIYVDGGHDYETVKQDWSICSQSLRAGGVIVLDDAAATTAYVPGAGSFLGHPGPSRVAAEVDASRFREVLQVGHNRVFEKIA